MENFDSTPGASNPRVLSVAFETSNELYAAYMSFIKKGALFVATIKPFNLGDELFLSIKMPDDLEKYSIEGRVVWITPPAAQEGKKAGIGVQFIGDNSQLLRDKIETILAGSLQSERTTDTM